MGQMWHVREREESRMTQRLSSNLDGWPFIEKRKAGRRGGTSKGD